MDSDVPHELEELFSKRKDELLKYCEEANIFLKNPSKITKTDIKELIKERHKKEEGATKISTPTKTSTPTESLVQQGLDDTLLDSDASGVEGVAPTSIKKTPPPSVGSGKGRGRGTPGGRGAGVSPPGVRPGGAMTAGESGGGGGDGQLQRQQQHQQQQQQPQQQQWDMAGRFSEMMNQMSETTATMKETIGRVDGMEDTLAMKISFQIKITKEETFKYIDENAVSGKQLEELSKVVKSSEEATKKAVRAVEEKTDEDRKNMLEKFTLMTGRMDRMEVALQNIAEYPVMNENMVASNLMMHLSTHESSGRNMIIVGIQEEDTEVEDTTAVVIADLLEDFKDIGGVPFHQVIREAQRVGRRKDNGDPYPRICKVIFNEHKYRDMTLDLAYKDTDRRIAVWNEWKSKHPLDWRESHDDKPKYRRYHMDVPASVRAKRKELMEVAQMTMMAGPEKRANEDNIVVGLLGNGDAKLLMACRNEDGEWESARNGAEAERYAVEVLRQFARKKGWQTRAKRAYTGAGAYLPEVIPEEMAGGREWVWKIPLAAIKLRERRRGGGAAGAEGGEDAGGEEREEGVGQF